MGRKRLDLRHILIFALLGTMQFCSKQALEFAPNVELVSTLTMVYTLVYRKYALIPILVFILLQGAFSGFGLWWFPYFYLWPVLWGVTMLLPKRMPDWLRVPVYAVVCGLFGLCYGSLLYAPFQCYAFLDGDWNRVPAWIAAGLPFDLIHAFGNLALGTLVWPLTCLLRRLETDRSDTH